MFIKKNIKILVLGLSFAILPVTIKGMEINTNKIRLNNEISTKGEKLLEENTEEIEEQEDEDFEYLSRKEVDNKIFILEENIEKLVKLKETTNNRILKETVKESINNTSDFILELVEENINKIINENLKNIKNWKIYDYLKSLKNYKKILINIKKETTIINLLDKINELINKINNKLPTLFKIYMLKTEKENLKNYKNSTDLSFERNIEFLKNFEQELIDLEKETHNDEINIILANAKNKVPKLLTNLYEKYYEKYIEKLKNKNINSMTIYEIKQQKDFLKKAQNTLNNLKNSTNNLEKINKLNMLINEIFKLIEKLDDIENIKQKDNFNINKSEFKQKFE